MPGITGIFSRRWTGQEPYQVERMTGLLSHESFYRVGTCLDQALGVASGHVEIIGSFADGLPLRNETGDILLLLTGECFDDGGETASLTARGHKIEGGKATYLVHLYEEEGERFFGRLNGWCNGLIIDRRTGRTHLFNDRYGIRRIYYRETPDGLYFSSEAKSLLAVCPETRAIDPRGLAEYLQYKSVFSNRTLFPGIYLLPPGSVWTFDGQRLLKRHHTDHRALESRAKLPTSGYMDQLEETFIRILPRYLAAESKCLALTGGLDTRLIIACADARPGDLPCLTHGGMYKEMLDVRIARRIAEACGQEHRVIPLGKGFLTEFPRVAERTIYLTDGLADVFQSHHLYLNELIRETAEVKITGKFGSQVIKHISAFHRPGGYGAEKSLFSRDFQTLFVAARDEFKTHEAGHPLSQMVFKEIPWWWSGIQAIESTQLAVCSPYLDNDFVDLLFQSPFAALDPVSFQLGLVKKKNAQLYTIMTDAGHGGDDRRISEPFRRLYYRAARVAEKIYGRDRLPYSMQHPLALIDYYLLSPFRLNRLVLGLADYRHYRIWTRDELSGYIKQILLDERTLKRPYWDRDFLEQAVSDHVAGRRNRLNEIGMALSVELVHRTLLENLLLREAV